jgi:hypothetical protein
MQKSLDCNRYSQLLCKAQWSFRRGLTQKVSKMLVWKGFRGYNNEIGSIYFRVMILALYKKLRPRTPYLA